MPRRKRSKKWISWLVILVLLVVAGVVIYLVWDNYFRDNGDEGQESEMSEQVEEDTKNDDVDTSKSETQDQVDDEEDEKKVKQYEGENPNKAEELSGAVTYAGVVDGKLMIRANIDQYLGDGNCKLSLISGNKVVYEDSARIISSASTATCEGFDVSTEGLSDGNYSIVIRIESGGKSGTIRGDVRV